MKRLWIGLAVLVLSLLSLQAQESTAPRILGFSCTYSKVTSLDVSGCTALTELNCGENQLTELDVSNNTALTSLDCHGNNLTSLDVSGCSALTSLDCDGNNLTNLDVSGCSALTYLYCTYNQLTSLDVSGCSALTYLYCTYNQLTSLDVSACAALFYLDCSYNRIPLSSLNECLHVTQLGIFDFYGQSDSITILINQDFDLSSERIIGQVLSTFEMSDAYGKEMPEGFWTENRFEFQFHDPLIYTLKLQNLNVKGSNWSEDPVTFTWHISVVEALPGQHTIKVASNNTEWGKATLTGNGAYEMGANVTITAMPNAGYRFVNWTKKDGTVFATTEVHAFAVTENLELTANFERIPADEETFSVKLSVSNIDWGLAFQLGSGRYGKNEVVTIIATPKDGYRFENWTKPDGTVFSRETACTFFITENLELTANFGKLSDDVANEGRETDNFHVYVQDRVIHLSADKGDVQVYNALGQCVYSGHATAIPVRNSGLYIVKIGKGGYKVMVR
ncbi:MAG: leucine-rich repeat domain-containing protein [Ruminococcus flavefaciens]|nr:leucine-rich repeat domain-containing protein [Ruminococcus flavefaciens]